MKTFVLCGGEGTRLRPYTYSMPKPMLDVAGKPLLQYVIENLKKNKLTDLVLTVGYLSEKITEYFGDGSRFNVKIEYLVEKQARGTAGSILPYKEKINDAFCVVMGDQISAIKLAELVESHKKSRAIATVALIKHRIPLEYGVAKLNAKGEVKEFAEKPIIENYLNTAMYVFEPKIFDYIKENGDFARDVFPRLLAKGERINGCVFEDSFFDIGRISDYDKINEMFKMIRLGNSLDL